MTATGPTGDQVRAPGPGEPLHLDPHHGYRAAVPPAAVFMIVLIVLVGAALSAGRQPWPR